MSDRTYNEISIGIESLVGRTINAALINTEKDAIILKTDEGDFFLNWEGDCCAHCYIAHISGTEFLVGSTIISAENTEWSDISRKEDEWDVLEFMGTKLKTSKGYVDIETRLSHNGYYSGMINVSKQGYVDAYNCLLDADEIEVPSTPVADF